MMAANIKALEERYWRLMDQLNKAIVALSVAATEHGMTFEQVLVPPTLDRAMGVIGELEVAGGQLSPEMELLKRLSVWRKERLDSLPPKLRAANVRMDELSGLTNKLQARLIHELFVSGIGIPAIAKRLRTKEDLVESVIGVWSDEDDSEA